jgi:glycerol-3-phosphate dehydrogenase
VDAIARGLGKAPAPCRTAQTPLHGADGADGPASDAPPRLRAIHGRHAPAILAACRSVDPQADRPLAPGTEVLRAEVLHALRHEMAMRLTDLALRRTDLGSERRPSAEALAAAAEIAAGVLGWNDARRQAELAEAMRVYPS